MIANHRLYLRGLCDEGHPTLIQKYEVMGESMVSKFAIMYQLYIIFCLLMTASSFLEPMWTYQINWESSFLIRQWTFKNPRFFVA